MIWAQHANGKTKHFEDVSSMIAWAATVVGVAVVDIRASAGGTHSEFVQVWIYAGKFHPDTAIRAGVSPEIYQAWSALV